MYGLLDLDGNAQALGSPCHKSGYHIIFSSLKISFLHDVVQIERRLCLNGSPVCSLVPPGVCQFGPDFTAASLLERIKVSPTSSLLRFGLPDANQPLNLSTCACILAKITVDGEDFTRPYTPISTNADIGHFDLLIKNYGEDTKMSRYMCEVLQPGEAVHFKHIDPNVKLQAPFPFDHILMLVGGTGLTPMVQALHAILGSINPTIESKKPKVTMLYGSKSSDDILGKDLLDQWAKDYPEQFKLITVLSDEPEDSDWKGERGYITKDLVADNFPSADADNLQVFVCGPPPMYNALSGPRDDTDKVGGLLGDMGYKPSQVYKF